MMLEMVAFYDEHEEGVELFVAVDEGDDVAWVRMSEHLGEERGREVSSVSLIALPRLQYLVRSDEMEGDIGSCGVRHILTFIPYLTAGWMSALS